MLPPQTILELCRYLTNALSKSLFRLNVQICHLQSLTDHRLWFSKFDSSCKSSAMQPAWTRTVRPPKNRSTKECAPRQVFQLHPAGVRTPCTKEGAPQTKDTVVGFAQLSRHSIILTLPPEPAPLSAPLPRCTFPIYRFFYY